MASTHGSRKKDSPTPSAPRHKPPLFITAASFLRAAWALCSAVAAFGIVSRASIPAAQAFAVDVSVRVPKAGGPAVMQVYVTDEANAGVHEFDCALQAGDLKVVLPDGRVMAEVPVSSPTMNLRLAVNRELAMVSADGSRVWMGERGLAADRGKRIGVRFLGGASDAAVKSVKVFGGK